MNADGPEELASILSAKDVFRAVKFFYDPTLLKLTKDNWFRKIQTLDKGSICILTTHGDFGENGSLQKVLEIKKIAHTHSPATVCGILLNKHLSKMFYKSLGISTPSWYFNDNIYGCKLNKMFSKKFVKKPLLGGSKVGIKKVNNISSGDVDQYIYETYVDGSIQISMSILGSGENALSLAPVIRKRPLFAASKYSISYNKIDQRIIDKCGAWAKKIHISLGCRGVTKTDFLLDKYGEIWAIETDAIPGLSKTNAISISAERSGLSYRELVSKILQDVYVE